MKKLQALQSRLVCIIAVFLGFTILSACSLTPSGKPAASGDTGFVAATVGNYDSADTAILIKKNTEEQTMTFYNMTVGRCYTLTYDGATSYADKYGLAISLEQIREGEMVDVTFMRGRKRLNSMALTAGTFHFEDVTNFETVGRKVYVGREEYTLDNNLMVITPAGRGELMDLSAVDKITLVGIDHTIYSIIVTQGHGYLRLENDSYFIGGWIEVSQSLIYPIEDDMLLTVPIGTYPVTVSGSGSVGTETITVEAGQETSLDVSKWQGEEKYGTIVFTVHPDTTRIYLDGESIDISKPQELSYGIHQMIAVADGYQTISKYIKVSMEYSSLDITLEPKNSNDDENSDSGTISENSVSDNSVSGNSVSENSVSENSISGNSVSNNSSSNMNGAQNSTTGMNGNETNTNSQNDNANNQNASTQNNNGENTNNGNGNNGNGNNGNSGGNNGGSQDSGNNQVISNNGEYKVFIDAPVGAEVYVDGSYVGIAPVSFAKRQGSFEVTLRRTGYFTRSYTITVDDSNKDINYSFSELLPIS